MSTVAAEAQITKVKMAGIEYGKSPDILETLLGSCIGVALWDRTSRTEALAHVVLPDSRGQGKSPGKFADTAIAEMRVKLVARGASPLGLVAKLAGGARMFGEQGTTDIGLQNHEAVLEHLERHKIRVAAEHVGSTKGRMIRFSLADGSVEVRVGREIVEVL